MPEETTQGRIASRYTLIEALGRGGMGVVWRARDELLQREIALKAVELPTTLPGSDRDAMRERVLREARTAARLNHPNAVTVYDVLEEDGRAFIAMELVEAPTLSDVIEREGPLSPERAAAVGLEVLGALDAAHRAGIVHRDVKPANVMVLPDGRTKLADFGIATVKGDPRLTATGQILGSPAYMSPEQARGEAAGAAADLWALGATLYYAVEGRGPFERGQAMATLTAIVSEEPQAPQRAGALGGVIDALLDKDPVTRPSSTRLAAMLGDVASGARATQVAREAFTPATRVETGTRVADDVRPAPAARRDRRWWAVVAVAVALVIAAPFILAALTDDDDPGRAGRNRRQGDRAGAAPSPDATASRPSPSEDQRPAVPEEWTTYGIADTGYQIAYPSDWSIVENATGDGTSTRFEDDQGRYLLLDWTDTPGDDAAEAWEQQADSFEESHDNYVEIRIEPTTFGDFDTAAIWEFTYTEGGADLHAIDLGFADDEWGFALNFQTHEDDWDSSQEIFEQFKASFGST